MRSLLLVTAVLLASSCSVEVSGFLDAGLAAADASVPDAAAAPLDAGPADSGAADASPAPSDAALADGGSGDASSLADAAGPGLDAASPGADAASPPDAAAVADAGPDGQPPTVPADLAAVRVAAAEVDLSWTASTDDVAVTGYDVLRDGVVDQTVATPSATVQGLDSLTAYAFAVRARDGAGNLSGLSSPPLQVTTLPLPRAMWVWDTTICGNAAKTTALLDFSQAHGVRSLYFQIADGVTANFPTNNLMATRAAGLRSLIAEADARGIAVELLFGRAELALVDAQPIALSLAQQAAAFAQGTSGARPTALHVDIEPHGIHGVVSAGTTWDWNTASQRQPMLNQLLDLLLAMKTALGTTMELHADTPHWWDTTDSSTAINFPSFARYVGGVRQSPDRPVYQWVLDATDAVALMDYNDGAATIAAQAAPETAYAAQSGKRVVVGVETLGCKASGGTAVFDPASGLGSEAETFCDEGMMAMEVQLRQVLGGLLPAAGQGGVAVHHYGSYSDPSLVNP